MTTVAAEAIATATMIVEAAAMTTVHPVRIVTEALVTIATVTGVAAAATEVAAAADTTDHRVALHRRDLEATFRATRLHLATTAAIVVVATTRLGTQVGSLELTDCRYQVIAM